jgi:hypothetical protein
MSPDGATGDDFVVVRDQVRVRVSWRGGSASRLELRVPYDEVSQHAREVEARGYRGGATLVAVRPMDIKLRPEGDAERKGKAAGVDVEFTVGDPEFDDAVYIDTATPPDVLRRVLGEAARAAVVELLRLGFTSITLDDRSGSVVAEAVTFASLEPGTSPGRRAVDAFARLARAMPRITRREGAHPEHPLRGANRALGLLAVVVVIGGGLVYLRVIAGERCPDGDLTFTQAAHCAAPGLVAGLAALPGALGAWLAAIRFSLRFKGRSDSSRSGALFAGLLGTVVFAVLTVGFAAFVVRALG